MLTSLLLLLTLPPYILLAGAFGIPYALLTRSPALLYGLGRFGVRMGFALARIRIVVRGSEHLEGEPHYIYMMNHNSNLDVPAVFLYVPGDVRILGKKELFRLPVLGAAMKLGGFVPVDRGRREEAIVSIQRAASIARAGASFLIAPEGTRSRTGKLLPFKKGGFYMAIDAEVPILPISVRGAYELMPPGSIAIRSGTIEVEFHEPIPTAGLTHADREWLMNEVRARIGSALESQPVVVSQ